MQAAGAYIDQIPAGAKPPTLAIRQGVGATASPAPPGVYVRVANAQTQAEAVRASLALTARLGPLRPRYIRGEAEAQAGGSRILMYAGPFATSDDVKAFCHKALAEEPCEARMLGPGATQGRR